MIGIATAVGAFRTREGGNVRGCDDNDGLTLGVGGAHVKVDVVGAVAAVQGCHCALRLLFCACYFYCCWLKED